MLALLVLTVSNIAMLTTMLTDASVVSADGEQQMPRNNHFFIMRRI